MIKYQQNFESIEKKNILINYLNKNLQLGLIQL